MFVASAILRKESPQRFNGLGLVVVASPYLLTSVLCLVVCCLRIPFAPVLHWLPCVP